jgi:hypothetical protein
MLKDDQVMKHNSVRQASIYLSEDDFTEVSMKALKNWLVGIVVVVALIGASASPATAQVVVRVGQDHPHHYHHRHHHHNHHNYR